MDLHDQRLSLGDGLSGSHRTRKGARVDGRSGHARFDATCSRFSLEQTFFIEWDICTTTESLDPIPLCFTVTHQYDPGHSPTLLDFRDPSYYFGNTQ
jgi:hypothetical protein